MAAGSCFSVEGRWAPEGMVGAGLFLIYAKTFPGTSCLETLSSTTQPGKVCLYPKHIVGSDWALWLLLAPVLSLAKGVG